ncbi:MAG TPA: cysteine hydrolase [Silvibacterium sp.]|jgi:nicotinamidase-related amidase|nr:cysteine hydrolase [Silvibacterium sp.]
MDTFDPRHTAVLALDCQTGIISVYAKPEADFIERASKVLNAARDVGMTVIQVQVGFRPGLPEVSDRNKLFGAIKASKPHQEFFQGSSGAIHPALGPKPDDIVIVKHRVSAFAGTDLDMILRAREIHTLVLFGISTSGVILSTLLEAGDADYRVAVIEDCCADLDLELHSALIRLLFPKRADVASSEDVVTALMNLR